MRNRRVHLRSSVAVIAACSLLVAACGGGSEEVPPAAAPTDATPAEVDDGQAAADDARDDGTAPPVTTTSAGDPALLSSVLRPAVERASADASYSFAMGMQLDMSAQGIEITMGNADQAFATGNQSGARTYLHTNIGSWMSSTFTNSFDTMLDAGDVPDDQVVDSSAIVGQILDLFDEMAMETWVDADEGVMVIDAAEFYSSLIGLGGLVGGELDQMAVLAEGPVLIRVDEMNGVLGEVYGSLGVSTGMATPEQMVEMLTSATDLREVGPGQVGSHAVTVYAATIDIGAMYETMGLELTDALGPDPESQQLADAVDAFVMDVTVMIDDDGLLRRIEIDLDMTELLADLDPGAAAQLGTYAMSMWQEFDQYGESFPFDPPDATDITDIYADLFAQTVI